MRVEEKERGVEVGEDKARDERSKNHKIRDKREQKLQDRIYIYIYIYNIYIYIIYNSIYKLSHTHFLKE